MQLSAAPSNYSSMSDSELDAAYKAVYDTKQAASGSQKLASSIELNKITQEITGRLAGFFGFARGLTGGARFPMFNEIQKGTPQGFVQSDVARQAVIERTKEVAGTLGKFAFGGAGLLLAAGVAYLLLTRRK